MKLPMQTLVLVLMLSAGIAGTVHAQELLVSAAVSLKAATEELGRQFQAARREVTLRYNFGASGVLQKQIEAGAPVDLFLSAGQRHMDELEAQGLLLPGSRRAFARNILVLVVPGDSRLDIKGEADLLRPRIQRVVIGNPKTVPAGQYAERSLRAQGLWEALRPKLVLAEDVRQAVQYVARGEVDAGFVYATDLASRRDHVRAAGRPAPESYPPIIYPAAILGTSKHPDAARAFLELLVSAEGQSVLARHGFQPAAGVAR